MLKSLCYLDKCAGVVELADAPDSKSGEGDLVWVRFPPPAPCICSHISLVRNLLALLNKSSHSSGLLI